jgi:hypothetical protein
MNFKGIGCESVDWNQVVQDSFQWRAFVNMVTDIKVPLKGGEFLDQLLLSNILYNFKHVATPARYFSKAGDTVPFYSRI